MISFSWPYLGFLILLPLILLLRPSGNKEQSALIKFPNINLIKNLKSYSSEQQGFYHSMLPYLWWIFWLLLVIALMRPEIMQQPVRIKGEGRDIILAVDLSRSMNALDFSTNKKQVTRLDAVKEVVESFIQGRTGDRIGLVAFAEEAFSYIPLSFDIKTVVSQLKGLEVGMAGEATAIADAILIATKQLRGVKAEKILILLTDGDDTASHLPPLQAAKLAKDIGIKIYTIGIGTRGKVPILNRQNQLVTIQGSINEELLEKIAATTGGLYSFAVNKQALQEVYSKIDSLEKSKKEANYVVISKELYQYPLALALFVLLIIHTLMFKSNRLVDEEAT